MIEPDYPHIVLTFTYRGFRVEIDQSQFAGQNIYAAWANYPQGCAMAVPFALTRAQAVKKAKMWINCRIRS